MQRVVLLFVAILSVVKTSPLGLDIDRLRNVFRVEKAGTDDYSYDYSYADEDYDYSDTIHIEIDIILKGLSDLLSLFGDLNYCGVSNNGTLDIPEEGCVLVDSGDVHFNNVLSRVDVEDVYKVLEDAGIEECVQELILPEDGCFNIDKDKGAIDLIRTLK